MDPPRVDLDSSFVVRRHECLRSKSVLVGMVPPSSPILFSFPEGSEDTSPYKGALQDKFVNGEITQSTTTVLAEQNYQNVFQFRRQVSGERSCPCCTTQQQPNTCNVGVHTTDWITCRANTSSSPGDSCCFGITQDNTQEPLASQWRRGRGGLLLIRLRGCGDLAKVRISPLFE